MNNALEVLGAMRHWWETNLQQRTPAQALSVGITYLYNNAYPEYQRMQQESSKIAHVRAMFTVWKAVCARLGSTYDVALASGGTRKEYNYPFYDPQIDAVRAFPLYIEAKLPDLFIRLIGQNVFLGVRFTDSERERHEKLRQAFTRPKDLSGKGRFIQQTQYPRGRP